MLVLNLNIFNWLQHRIYHDEKVLCSVWEYFKHIFNPMHQLSEAINTPDKMVRLLDVLMEMAPKLMFLEKKK